jgi:hypothetical protein
MERIKKRSIRAASLCVMGDELLRCVGLDGRRVGRGLELGRLSLPTSPTPYAASLGGGRRWRQGEGLPAPPPPAGRREDEGCGGADGRDEAWERRRRDLVRRLASLHASSLPIRPNLRPCTHLPFRFTPLSLS